MSLNFKEIQKRMIFISKQRYISNVYFFVATILLPKKNYTSLTAFIVASS